VIQALEIDRAEVREAIRKDYAEWEQRAKESVPMQMFLRLTGVIILPHDMPAEITSREAAIEYAQDYARKSGFRVCLALSRRESAWIAADGKMHISQTTPGVPNIPYVSLGGKKFIIDLSKGTFAPVVLRS
jgi:hypothetical protein